MKIEVRTAVFWSVGMKGVKETGKRTHGTFYSDRIVL